MFLQFKLNRQRWVLALTASVLASVLVACGSNNSSSSSSTQPIYTGVFDAGSSGTRLSFFKVVPGNGGYPGITLLSKFIDKMNDIGDDDGINDFLNDAGVVVFSANDTINAECTSALSGKTPVTNANGDKVYSGLGTGVVGPCVLQPQLAKLEQQITSLNAQNPGLNLTKSQVLVELFATAGMRTEEQYNGGLHDATTIRNYYDGMKQFVANLGYSTGEFKTINGNSEEGLWTWINMNDQYFNAFGGNKTYWSGAPTTRGDFEVGGSSMQIAFPTTQVLPGDDNNVYTVKINGYTYNVYSKTYLGLGGDDMRKFMRAYGYTNLTPEYNGGTDCFGTSATSANTAESSGVRLFYNAAFFFNSGTITTNAVNNTWTPNLPKGSFPMQFAAGVTGSFNPTSCTTKYNNITTQVMALPRNSYGTIPNQATPSSYSSFVTAVGKSSAPFIGIDGFYHSSNALGLVSNANPISSVTQATFQAAYTNLCNTGYVGDNSRKLKTSGSCAGATYMQDFLWRTNGLFTSNTGATFEGVAPNDFNGNEVLTWTRGYLLKKYAN